MVSSKANIRDIPFNQKSPGHPEEGVLNCHRPKDGHRYSLTESAHWADSVKSRNKQIAHKYNFFFIISSSPVTIYHFPLRSISITQNYGTGKYFR